MSSGLTPSAYEFRRLPNGAAQVRLPNDVVRVYSEGELAEMTIQLIEQCDAAPETVDEAWLVTVQELVGKERWEQALEIYAAATS